MSEATCCFAKELSASFPRSRFWKGQNAHALTVWRIALAHDLFDDVLEFLQTPLHVEHGRLSVASLGEALGQQIVVDQQLFGKHL